MSTVRLVGLVVTLVSTGLHQANAQSTSEISNYPQRSLFATNSVLEESTDRSTSRASTSLASTSLATATTSNPVSTIALLPSELTDHSARTSLVSSQSLYVGNASLFDEFTALVAFDGSKQPQDFGVNANAGLQGSVNWGLPLLPTWGIGMQLGTNYTATENAVRVYELLGETTTRHQSFTTIGFFQRLENGFAWGGVYDFLYEDSYDNFALGQWRLRGSYRFSSQREVGVTANLRSNSDSGVWGAATPVTLKSINQGSMYYRKFWTTGAQTTIWGGLADRHSEDNVVTGQSPAQHNSFLFGADVLMPLNSNWAIYGEANMITPFDTGTVDAFLGIQWYPTSRSFSARRGWFSPLFSTASPVSFAVDLFQ